MLSGFRVLCRVMSCHAMSCQVRSGHVILQKSAALAASWSPPTRTSPPLDPQSKQVFCTLHYLSQMLGCLSCTLGLHSTLPELYAWLCVGTAVLFRQPFLSRQPFLHRTKAFRVDLLQHGNPSPKIDNLLGQVCSLGRLSTLIQ